MLPSIHLFGFFELPLYGPVFIGAFLVTLFFGSRIAPKYGVAKEDIVYGSIYGALGLIVGAKAVFFLTKLPDIISHWDLFCKLIKHAPIEAISYAFGGWVFYGGLIGTFLGILRYSRHFKVPVTPFLDVFAPFIPLVHGFGRIGCFLAGCCYGIEYHGPFSVQFPFNEFMPELHEVPRFPVQLLEAGLNFVMFGVLFTLLRKRKMLQGRMLGVYLIYYVVARYFLEMLRGDINRGKVGVFSTSQLISLLLVPVAIMLLTGKVLPKLDASLKKDENCT
ncbi:MAG: prolipoprotein diacylglyceryl transferase [Lachnospiraceae bacterium]|nr:prolipoprotein diacylglyceryl transferase [Lachnospiraceae bacterium]